MDFLSGRELRALLEFGVKDCDRRRSFTEQSIQFSRYPLYFVLVMCGSVHDNRYYLDASLSLSASSLVAHGLR